MSKVTVAGGGGGDGERRKLDVTKGAFGGSYVDYYCDLMWIEPGATYDVSITSKRSKASFTCVNFTAYRGMTGNAVSAEGVAVRMFDISENTVVVQRPSVCNIFLKEGLVTASSDINEGNIYFGSPNEKCEIHSAFIEKIQ